MTNIFKFLSCIFLVDIICKWVKETAKSLSRPTAVDEEKIIRDQLNLWNFLIFFLPFVSFCVFISIFMILTSFPRKNIRELQFHRLNIFPRILFFFKMFGPQNQLQQRHVGRQSEGIVHWSNRCFLYCN